MNIELVWRALSTGWQRNLSRSRQQSAVQTLARREGGTTRGCGLIGCGLRPKVAVAGTVSLLSALEDASLDITIIMNISEWCGAYLLGPLLVYAEHCPELVTVTHPPVT